MINMSKNAIKTSLLCSIILICVMAMFVFTGYNIVYADENILIQFDNAFEDILEQVGVADGEDINIRRRLLYDINLNQLGFLYKFSASDISGFSIILNSENGLDVTEICLNAVDPYENIEGNAVYINEFNYWEENQGEFRCLQNRDISLTKQEITSIFPNRYCAVGDSLTSSTETVNYVDKTVDSYKMAYTIPSYYYEDDVNSCVPVAGGNIIAYYDRYKTNLIENYTPGMGIGNLYKYKSQNETVEQVIEQLYDDMETNVNGAGSTVTQFIDGLSDYCERQNYSVNYTSCLNGNGNLDYNFTISKIQSGMPIALFVQKMSIANIEELNNSDRYNILQGEIMHAMSAFGYEEITYNTGNGQQTNKQFLLVATGIKRMPTAYLNVNNMLELDYAYAVEIY